MAYVMISSTFFMRPEVAEAGNRAIGVWIRLASYHAGWPTYDIPRGVRRMCGAKPTDIDTLVRVGLLEETADGWRLGLKDQGIWKLAPSVDSRTARPAIPALVRKQVMERDEYTCLFCGATEDLTLDHIHPWSLGGPDTVENLRVLCRRCNSVRGNRVEVDA